MRLQSQAVLARAVLLAVFLIPIGQSSLRGLNHVLLCSRQVETPFEVMIIQGQAVVISATELRPGESGLCGGLSVNLAASVLADGRLEVTIPIENHTENDWYGSVELKVMGVRIPLDLGQIDAGETRRREITIDVPAEDVKVEGSLLVGP